MKKALRIGGVVLLALVLIGAGILFLQRRQTRPATEETPIPTTTVIRGSIEETVSATGNVAAERQAALAFEMSGPIAEVLVSEGQEVEAGQVLARLDTASLEWQVARAQASLDTAQARLDQAAKPSSAAELASAQATLDGAVANYDKVKAGPTKEELASAQAALDSALASYDKVKAGPTKDELASAQAALGGLQRPLCRRRVSDRPDRLHQRHPV